MKVDSSALETLKDHSEATYDKYKKTEGEEILVHFVGDLNKGYANAISTKLEQIVEAEVPDKQARKRFYTAYIEAMQNIRIHGCMDDQNRLLGSVLVSVNANKICARFLNLIEKGQGEYLLERYAEINNMDRIELKKVYLDQMMNGELSTKGGAGLGIITIVLRSQNPSEVQIVEAHSDFDLFESAICVDYKS